MAELMDHPFVNAPQGADESVESKLTVLKPDVFLKDQNEVSEGSKKKPINTTSTNLLESKPIELTT